MAQKFDEVAQICGDNRVVAFETDIALGKHAGDQRAYGCTGNAHWLLYSFYDKHNGSPVFLKLLNASVLDECVASVAFYVRNSLDYRLTKLTEFKTIDMLAGTYLIWNPYPDVPSDHLVGARIRLLRKLESKVSFDNLPPTDVVFVANGVEIPAHKAYLSVVSPVFAKMFEGNFREASEGRVTIENADPEDFRAVIAAAYPAKVPPTEKNVLAVLTLADRYDVASVVTLCTNFLKTASGVPLIDKFIVAEQYEIGLQEYLVNELTAAVVQSMLKDDKASQLSAMTKELLKSQFGFKSTI
ncbi:BTB/POZ domain-containing protein [Aphelenchoides avenae]|nr:BTB/POZ domain-containing protein [Aphelenchus avenae]